MREVDKETDRSVFDGSPTGPPLYEGRMVAQYDYRAKAYRTGRGRSAYWEDLRFDDPRKSIIPQWYIPLENAPEKTAERIQHYRIGFCNFTSPTNERTLIAALIPPNTIGLDSLFTFTYHNAPLTDYRHDGSLDWHYLIWLAVANSFAMDYLARQKVSLHMTYTIVDSLSTSKFRVFPSGVITPDQS